MMINDVTLNSYISSVSEMLHKCVNFAWEGEMGQGDLGGGLDFVLGSEEHNEVIQRSEK